MRLAVLIACAVLLGLAPASAGEPAECERGWTFPVPFFQSVAWAPDGSRIAFAAVTRSWDEGYAIFLATPDGSELVKIDTGGDRALFPAFSPDGSRIAFQARHDGNSDVYVSDLAGGRLERLTEHPASDGYPSWSPDGSRLAFHSDRDGDYEIWVMNADGSEPVAITDHPGDDYNPAWSPDGGRIAFDSDRDDVEGDEIYVVSPDGSDLQRVVEAGVFPTWAPDGASLLFTLEGLWSVALDGARRSRLLEHAVFGAWSPDGGTVAAARTRFDRECKDHHDLVLLAPDGKVLRELTP